MRGESFESFLKIAMQPRILVVDGNGGGDMHGVAKEDPLPDARFGENSFVIGSDVDECAYSSSLGYEFFAPCFHDFSPSPRPVLIFFPGFFLDNVLFFSAGQVRDTEETA